MEEAIEEYHRFIEYDGTLPKEIMELTGLIMICLSKRIPNGEALLLLKEFVGNYQ